jgi:diadenosine tetraphosphate (Ap4A) HIT family hydrolase
MDIILPEHTPDILEKTFDSVFLYNHPLYSLMAEKTEMKWLLVVPKKPLDANSNLTYIQELYGSIYQLIAYMQANKIGEHFNIAKIGNKNPNQHIHLIFRETDDEVWPDAVWCHEPLKASLTTPETLKMALKSFYDKV